MNKNILHRSLMAGSMKESIDINDYLTIEALEDGLTVSLSVNACQYCIDGSMEWVSLAANTSTPAINTGQIISFRASEISTSSYNGIGTFTISKKCNLLGNCMSMLFGGFANGENSLIGYNYAFYRLFYANTTICGVSEQFLPATTLAPQCYSNMFTSCTSLTNAPELPATTLAQNCYSDMFYGCTSLIDAPALPATTMAYECYSDMFWGCRSLVNAPALPATTLANRCYYQMFRGCTSLVNAPELPATTLAGSCYLGTFYGCTSLVNAPELPATILAGGCYGYMLHSCTSLVNAPTLPATTLSEDCYQYMFGNCTSLIDAPALPATTLAEDCYYSMFYDCTSLVNAPALPATTLANRCYYQMFRGCTSLVNAPKLPATTLALQCYSYMFTSCTSLTNAPELPATTLADGCYQSMFYSCRSLINASELPATTLVYDCYRGMYEACTSLVNAPELPATTLAYQCYWGTFYGCTSLVNAPALPATTLADYCYYATFYGCTSLIDAPALPAMTLTEGCYQDMFYGCTSLVNAPTLPATMLADRCYYRMFRSCSSLSYIKMLAIDVSASLCLKDWVDGVSSTGIFLKNLLARWDIIGSSGIPEGWSIAYPYTPQECLSLTITADDVLGRNTTTTIYWEATTNGIDEEGSPVQGVVLSGKEISAEFPQNTSETDTVTREISFTYMGVTATTTITQGVWMPREYVVDLNSQWQISMDIANPDPVNYDGVYESFSNYNKNNEYATMYIDFFGYNTFRLYIRSYAESSYDYVMVSQLDQAITGNTSYSDSTLVKAHTRSSQSSGSSISNYQLVEFPEISDGEHRITIVYRKDSSNHVGTDKGYVLIPKNQ